MTRKLSTDMMIRPIQNMGAVGRVITVADSGYHFISDNSGAIRTITLPLISAVPAGFTFSFSGSSSNFPMWLALSGGSEVIDSGAAFQTLPLPGRTEIIVYSDGTQWWTNFDYSSYHTVASATGLSVVSLVSFDSFPYWANNLRLSFRMYDITPGTNFGVQLSKAASYIGSGYGIISRNTDTSTSVNTTAYLYNAGSFSWIPVMGANGSGTIPGSNSAYWRGMFEMQDIKVSTGYGFGRVRGYGKVNSSSTWAISDNAGFLPTTGPYDGIRMVTSGAGLVGSIWLEMSA